MSSTPENHSRTNGSARQHPVLRVSHLRKVFKVRSGDADPANDSDGESPRAEAGGTWPQWHWYGTLVCPQSESRAASSGFPRQSLAEIATRR